MSEVKNILIVGAGIHGCFLGKYLMSLIPIELYQFKTEISYTCLAIGISFFFLSLGLTFKNWMNLIKTFSSIIISFVSKIFKNISLQSLSFKFFSEIKYEKT